MRDRGRGAGDLAPPTAAGRSAASATSRALSFHETKNVISRRGRRAARQRAASSSSAPRSSARRAPTAARSSAARSTSTPGCDIGSSYLPGEIIAAFLWAQIEHAEAITRAPPGASGQRYHDALRRRSSAPARLRRPIVPRDCQHNAHMYYLLLPDARRRAARSSSACARAACTRCSTTCRCTPRPPAAASAAPAAACA